MNRITPASHQCAHRRDRRRRQRGLGRIEVPALLGGERIRRVRHQRRLLRPDIAQDLHEPLIRVALYVELHRRPVRAHQLRQQRHVGRADMPLIPVADCTVRPWPGFQRQTSKPEQVGHTGAA